MSEIDEKIIFSDNLRYWMSRKGYSQVDLADGVGVSEAAVSFWLSAKKYPTPGKIQKIADLLGLKKSDLIDKHDRSEESNDEFRNRMKAEYGALFDLVEKADEKQRRQIESIVRTIVGDDNSDDWGA